MEFRLEDNERAAMIEILTGKLMHKACVDNKCSYDRMSKYKNKIFPQFKSKRKYEYSAEDAAKFLDFALTSLKVRKLESVDTLEIKPIKSEDVSFKNEPGALTDANPGTRMINLGPLERMDKPLFIHVIKVAHAAMTWEKARNLFKGTM